MLLYYILAAIAGAVIALAIYIAVSRAANKGRAAAIIEKAEIEGENIKQQKILQARKVPPAQERARPEGRTAK